MVGGCEFKSESIKMKLFGGATHVSGVFAPGVVLTRTMFRLNKVPEPESGVKSFENADKRRVRIGPPPGRIAALIIQLLLVSPAAEIAEVWNVITDESKVKSP